MGIVTFCYGFDLGIVRFITGELLLGFRWIRSCLIFMSLNLLDPEPIVNDVDPFFLS